MLSVAVFAVCRSGPRRHGINQKTVAKWQKRQSAADRRTGPTVPRSTVLSVERPMTARKARNNQTNAPQIAPGDSHVRFTPDRRAFSRAVATGRAVTEFGEEDKAALDIRAVWTWFKKQLQ